MVVILLVPKGLIYLVFDLYHACGVGVHLGINKTIIDLRNRLLWSCMRKTIIAWVLYTYAKYEKCITSAGPVMATANSVCCDINGLMESR